MTSTPLKSNSIVGLSAVLAVICLLVFYPVLQNDFVNWDDDEYVTANETIRSLSALNIRTMLTEDLTGKYHPLTMLSFALEYHFFKLDPFYYHATNLLLHVVNVLLVFWFLRLLFADVAMAFIASLLFAIHPLQVEPVAWVSSRKDMLFMLFYVAALIVYLKDVSSPQAARRWWSGICLYILFIFSLLSKAMAISLPLLLILIDHYRSQRFDIKHIIRKWPFFVIALCIGAFTLTNAGSSDAFPNTALYPLWERALYSCFALVLYVIKIIVPFPLSCFYALDISWPALILSVVIVILGAVLIYLTFQRRSIVVFCFLFMLLTIWPVLHIFQMNDSIIYERFMYLPSIGLFILIAHGLRKASRLSNPIYRVLIYSVFLSWVVGLMVVAHRQTRVWYNSATLWSNVIKYFPNAYPAYNNMGIYMEQQGRFDEALHYFMRMIEVNPKYAEGYFKLGNILALKFDRTGAIRYYSKAIEYNPKHHVAFNNRGNQYLIAGMYDRALEDYASAIALKNDYTSAYVNRGMCYFAMEDYAAAAVEFEKVLTLDPHHQRVLEKMEEIKKKLNP